MRSLLMKSCLRAAVLLALGAVLVMAQSDTAVLFGLIKDPSGATVAGAKVQLRNEATGAIRELKADDKGLFYFTLLPPGSYEFVVEATGFTQYRDSHVVVQG